MQIQNIALIGTGAIGMALASQFLEARISITLFSRGVKYKSLKNGLYYINRSKGKNIHILSDLTITEDFSLLESMDIIIIVVKNYSLVDLCESIASYVRKDAFIISIANGSKNSQILPRYFQKVIYGIVFHNAYVDYSLLKKDKKFLVSFQDKLPLLIGTYNNNFLEEMKAIKNHLNPKQKLGWPIKIIQDLNNTIHHKLVINLFNAFDALAGLSVLKSEFSKIELKQIHHILANLYWEGLKVIQAAGYQESNYGMLSWKMIRLNKKLPQVISFSRFLKIFQQVGYSSTYQDLEGKQIKDTELEDLTGYILTLAKKHNISVKYNQAIYDLLKKQISNAQFSMVSIAEIMNHIQSM